MFQEWIYTLFNDKMNVIPPSQTRLERLTFRCSSMGEQEAVNLEVRGPNPLAGARHKSAPGFAKDRCSLASVKKTEADLGRSRVQSCTRPSLT